MRPSSAPRQQDGDIHISAQSLAADQLTAGLRLETTTSRATTLGGFASGTDAVLSGSTLALGDGAVGGDLSAQANAGALGFADLSVGGDAALSASAALTGGNVAAGGSVSLGGASITVGTVSGSAGVTANTPGSASFTALNSANGDVALDAGSAVSGGSASAGGSVTLTGASVALDTASFGDGLAITARSGDLTGTGLYQGTGAVALQAARGIAIGSVDTLGGITLAAGAEARFVELRSRDGSVGVTATGAIAGSSVAATGSNPAGDDSVSLTAGGAITLDGITSRCSTRSAARRMTSPRARAGRWRSSAPKQAAICR